MRKILITGAFGFVGRNLSRHLAGEGVEVWGLDVGGVSAEVLTCERSKVERGLRQDAMTRAEGESNAQRATLNAQRSNSGRGAYARCFNWGQMAEIPWGSVEAVIHLAGKAHDTRHTAAPQEYFDINLGLTERIYERVLAAPVRTFIQFSSVKAVADRVEGLLTEDAAPDPQTPYGKSKLAAERHLLAAPLDADRRLYILRPCMIHGPGNKGNLNLLYQVVRRGLPWPLGAFENRRSFASIGNVCAVVSGLLEGKAASGVYQVADDEALSTNELVALMAGSLGRRPRIWRVNRGFVRWCARVGDRLHLPLTTERLEKLTESYVVSNAKLKRALGIARFPVTSTDGLRATLKVLECGDLAPLSRA